VLETAFAYLILGWLLIQVADIVFGQLFTYKETVPLVPYSGARHRAGRAFARPFFVSKIYFSTSPRGSIVPIKSTLTEYLKIVPLGTSFGTHTASVCASSAVLL